MTVDADRAAALCARLDQLLEVEKETNCVFTRLCRCVGVGVCRCACGSWLVHCVRSQIPPPPCVGGWWLLQSEASHPRFRVAALTVSTYVASSGALSPGTLAVLKLYLVRLSSSLLVFMLRGESLSLHEYDES